MIIALSKPPWPSLFLLFLAKLSIFNALQLWNQQSVFTFQSGSRNQTILANTMQYHATMNCHQYQIHAILLTIINIINTGLGLHYYSEKVDIHLNLPQKPWLCNRQPITGQRPLGC